MKFAALAFLTVIAASADDKPSLSGKWEVFTSAVGQDSTMKCTFVQNDADLSGSCDAQSGKVEITGKVDGAKVSFSYKSEHEGTPLTVKYDGTMASPTRIQGNIEVPEFGVTGNFTANQSK